jgi:hypothetical protein
MTTNDGGQAFWDHAYMIALAYLLPQNCNAEDAIRLSATVADFALSHRAKRTAQKETDDAR